MIDFCYEADLTCSARSEVQIILKSIETDPALVGLSLDRDKLRVETKNLKRVSRDNNPNCVSLKESSAKRRKLSNRGNDVGRTTEAKLDAEMARQALEISY